MAWLYMQLYKDPYSSGKIGHSLIFRETRS